MYIDERNQLTRNLVAEVKRGHISSLTMASRAAVPGGPTESQGWRRYLLNNDSGLAQNRLFHVRRHKSADVPV